MLVARALLLSGERALDLLAEWIRFVAASGALLF
jgi:hypothetical protein